MNYLGKLLGGIAGLATGKWPLALFGLVLGHQFDRGYQKYARGALPSNFVPVAFSIMGHLAKADGRVSEDEIRWARTAMHALSLSGEQTRAAMQHFNRGKDDGFALERTLGTLREQAGAGHATGRRLVELLLPILLMKREASAQERRVLWQVCQEFGISRVELAQIEAATRIEQRFKPASGGAGQQDDATHAFAILGLSVDASDKEIKKAYRRLTNRYHPDKLSGAKASSDALTAAGKKTREIRKAYELLRDRRGFK
ncbi:MAG: co-chaperone DjlA [Pseudomonadota bacterium]